jgi:hypothetical protein
MEVVGFDAIMVPWEKYNAAPAINTNTASIATIGIIFKEPLEHFSNC